jgi:lysine 2,3-aminomutase
MLYKISSEEISSDSDDPLGVKLIKKVSNSPVLNQNSENHIISDSSLIFLRKHFPQATVSQWNDWRWQLANSITSYKKLSTLIDVSSLEDFEILAKNKNLPLRITPYYAHLMDETETGRAIAKGVVPSLKETIIQEVEESDPLHEENFAPVNNLVHRYPDRVLFLSTGFCSTYCRYCTRSHMVAKEKVHLGKNAWQPAIEYVKNNKNVRDVVISGGDPLTMTDENIEYLLKSLREIEHVEIIRIGSKVPVVLPQRITENLLNILKKYHPVYMSIHFMHPAEITPEVSEACEKLANAGLPLGSQVVLLKDINDSVETMKTLMQKLLRIRVRPYYIYQCDPIPGSSHFRTPVSKGLEIIQGLRGHTSGYAVPQFVIDAPGGGGKIPLLPEYYVGKEGNNIILKNYEGKIFKYPD